MRNPYELTPREIEVAELMASGYSNQQIADELIMATTTVRTHLSTLYSKLDAHNRLEASRLFREVYGDNNTVDRLRYDLDRLSREMQDVRRQLSRFTQRLSEMEGTVTWPNE